MAATAGPVAAKAAASAGAAAAAESATTALVDPTRVHFFLHPPAEHFPPSSGYSALAEAVVGAHMLAGGSQCPATRPAR